MKLKNMIIDNEYNENYPWEKEYTDWISCLEYDYSETDNIPGKLAVTNRTVLHFDNEEFSPFATVNS